MSRKRKHKRNKDAVKYFEPYELFAIGETMSSVAFGIMLYGKDNTYLGVIAQPEIAKRIRLCVNACEGVSDEELRNVCRQKKEEKSKSSN